MIRSVAFALIVLLSATAASAQPVAPPASAADAQARIQTFLRELSAFAQSYTVVVERSERLTLAVIDGAQRALDEFRADSPHKAGVWTLAWAAQIRAEQQVIRDLQGELPPAPDAAFARLGPVLPAQAAALRRGYARMPGAATNIVSAANAMVDRSLPLVERTARGDTEALLPLGREIMDGIILTLEAENVMLDISITTSPDHPQGALSRAAKAGNEAMVAMLASQSVLLEGEEPDGPALAAEMRTKGEEARAAAAQVEPLAAELMTQAAAVLPNSDLRAKLQAITASYSQSSRTEARIADAVVRTAERIERGDDIAETVEAELAVIETLVEARMAEQQERLRLLAQ